MVSQSLNVDIITSLVIIPQLMFCILHAFIVDCAWSSWSDWTSCSKACGRGVGERSRRVQTPAQNGGSQCQGVSTQTRICNEQNCPGK